MDFTVHTSLFQIRIIVSKSLYESGQASRSTASDLFRVSLTIDLSISFRLLSFTDKNFFQSTGIGVILS